jgi:hypothetical protein
MAITADPSRFVYRGNAVPLGGRVINIEGKPVNRPIPSPPTASLTVVGGLSRGAGRGSSFINAFKWGATVAESIGELPDPDRAVTTVTSSIADVVAVNKPIVFEADRLKIVLVSEHHQKATQPAFSYPEVVFGGEKGLSLDGKPIRVEVDRDLVGLSTFDSIEKQYRKDPAFFKKYAKCFRRPEKKVGVFGERLPRVAGYVSGSIVRRIVWGDQRIQGHVLKLEGFGRIYFGEILMNENHRRITMVRLAMGSAIRGDIAYAEADHNGSWD